ncbi:hypothetical protein O3M35_009272 [Rhynocoris fuscipes]
MEGAGTDATTLFNQVHSWVNFESILNKCVVGRMVAAVDSDIFASPPKPGPVKHESAIKLDWSQQSKSVTFYLYLKEPLAQLSITNIPDDDELWVLANGIWIGWSLLLPLKWPPSINLPTNDMQKVEIKLDKVIEDGGPKMWQEVPKQLPLPAEEKKIDSFLPCNVVSIFQINHNVYTITLEFLDKIYRYVPVGHHVALQASLKGQIITRNYTPITNLLHQPSFPTGITFMVKSYSNGIFSSWLTTRKVGDILKISEPCGTFSVSYINETVTHLILIAAGTGFTPMVRIINWALQPHKRINVKLLFFNKSEKDIIWKRELSHLMGKNSRFVVEYVLSEANSCWKGKRGYITPQLLETVLPVYMKCIPFPYFVCVCGPSSFTQLAERYLQDMDYPTSNYYCFRG